MGTRFEGAPPRQEGVLPGGGNPAAAWLDSRIWQNVGRVGTVGMGGFTLDGDMETGAARVGAELRSARQRLGWQLPDVANMLRIRLPYLEAIEDGRVADLPGSAYAVGFLRTYASALGLDADELSRRFRAEASGINRRTELNFPAPVPERGVPAGAVVLLGVVLAVGGYFAWYRLSGDTRPVHEEVAALPDRLNAAADRVAPGPAAVPAPAPAGGPAPAATAAAPGTAGGVVPAAPASVPRAAVTATMSATAAPSAIPTPPPPVPVPVPVSVPSPQGASAPDARPDARLILRVKADSWINVRERQGPVLLNRVMRTGETWPVPQRAQLLLTTGNAGATELMVDGQLTAPLGANGVVKRDIPLDPELVKAGKGPAGSTQAPASR